LPNVPEDYVHRIGRTGRAGNPGVAVSLVCGEEFDYLKGIQKLLGRTLPAEEVAGFPFTESPSAPPPQGKRQPRRQPDQSRPRRQPADGGEGRGHQHRARHQEPRQQSGQQRPGAARRPQGQRRRAS
ncbi:MAG: hypothetical protein R3310_06490, partial [Candidatus Competibacteraceae bacterium]|nr:hypothetical protein [Candidatus Competibacteraceae bacterium]